MRGSGKNQMQASMRCPVDHTAAKCPYPKEDIDKMYDAIEDHLLGIKQLEQKELDEYIRVLGKRNKEELLKESPLPLWPRPFYPYKAGKDAEEKSLPVPWLSNSHVLKNEWAAFDDRSLSIMKAKDFCLCHVCGKDLDQTKVFLSLNYDDDRSSGGPLHPRCALLSLKYCPHFEDLNKSDAVFRIYKGMDSGIGMYELLYSDDDGFECTAEFPSEVPDDKLPLQRIENFLANFPVLEDAEYATYEDVKKLVNKYS